MAKRNFNGALRGGAAAALALLVGGGLYFAMQKPAAEGRDDHAGLVEGDHAGEDAAQDAEGFVALTPAQFQAAGIGVVGVSTAMGVARTATTSAIRPQFRRMKGWKVTGHPFP
jgi:membrane fusion protein, heavy metal efflux system